MDLHFVRSVSLSAIRGNDSMVGLVAPRLISFDLRSRGYLLYLSRPLTPGEYVMGKAGVLCVSAFLHRHTASLAIYVAGLCLSTDPGAIWMTWDIPFRIIALQSF